MKAIELMSDRLVKRLSEGFEGFLATAEEVEVIPWQDDFAVADRNPENYIRIEELVKMLNEKKISVEEFQNEYRKLAHSYVSITMGIAFVNEKKISFRTMPPHRDLLLHELGHVHFQVGDKLWSSTYGGAEVLLWIHASGLRSSSEKMVWDFILFKSLANSEPETAHRIFLRKMGSFLRRNNIQPHIGALMVHLGSLLDGDLPIDPADHAWKEVPVTSGLLESAIAEITSGICVNDLSSLFVAEKMGWLK